MPPIRIERAAVLQTPGPLLLMGGPGSGKTTIALELAGAEAPSLLPGQKILFLSFARATVSRLNEHAHRIVHSDARRSIEINTYHGFAWSVLRSHGYLLRAGGKLAVLSPGEAASRLSRMSPEEKAVEIQRIQREEGLVHFDLFAKLVAELFQEAPKLAQVYGATYPTIILDEFQDTSAEEWGFVRRLAAQSRIVAIADPEQRIYEFRGADPRRVDELIEASNPSLCDFGSDNFRSNGRDIADFGRDLLLGQCRDRVYNDVKVTQYPFYRDRKELYFAKTSLLQRMGALRQRNESWSIGLLVNSRKLMLQMSDYLDSAIEGLPALSHTVAIDSEGPALAAEIIARLMETDDSQEQDVSELLRLLVKHMRGRKGDDAPSQATSRMCDAFDGYLETGRLLGSRRRLTLGEAGRITELRRQTRLTGDPEADWLTIRSLLEQSQCDHFQTVADDAKYLRLLRRGAVLRSRLGELWRKSGGYRGATQTISSALIQEHFRATTHKLTGIHVMTIHKSKGKEFDEVVIFEGLHNGKLIRAGQVGHQHQQAVRSLRVGATRARERCTILTPASDPCPLL